MNPKPESIVTYNADSAKTDRASQARLRPPAAIQSAASEQRSRRLDAGGDDASNCGRGRGRGRGPRRTLLGVGWFAASLVAAAAPPANVRNAPRPTAPMTAPIAQAEIVPVADSGSRAVAGAAHHAFDPAALRLPVGSAGGATLPLLEVLPRRRSVLILIDPDALSSQQWLRALQASGYRGYGALVLVLDRPTASAPIDAEARPPASPKQAALLRQLPEAIWLHSQAGPALAQLQVAGTPQAIGFDANRQLRWRQSPTQGDAEQLTLRLLDWVLPPKSAPVKAAAP